MKMNYSYNEMKRTFECGRNFQLTGENNFQELIEELNQPSCLGAVSSSCPCGVPYVETKKSDIPYDTDDNVYYTDILIHHCPKCGNIDRIDEY
jgi:hypothetical protein